jgi:Signal transduction histidine kinase
MSMKKFLYFFFICAFLPFCGQSATVTLKGTADSTQDTILVQYDNLSGKEKLNKMLDLSKKYLTIKPGIAKQLASKATLLAIEINAAEEQGYALLYYGNAAFLLGDYFNAQESFGRSMEIAKRLGTQQLIVDIFDAQGSIYASTGDFEQALKNYKSAFQILIKLNFPTEKSNIIRKIGNIYAQFGENNRALDFYQIALETSRKNNDSDGIGMAFNNIGRIYVEEGKYDLALDYFNKALEIKERQGKELSKSNTLLNLGQIYEKMGRFSLAESYFNKTIKIRTRFENKEGIAEALQGLAQTYTLEDRLIDAERLLYRSIKIADSLNLNLLKVAGYKKLSELYAKKGDFREAYLNYQQYNIYKDSIYSTEKARMLVDVDARYKFEVSNNTIKILSKDAALKLSELRKARWVGYFWATLFLFFVIVSYLLYSRIKLKSEINEKLQAEVNERKKVHNELERYQKDLELLVEDRTLQLREAKDRAEQSDKLKSAFLGNISHEIRTPMNAIIGFANLLQEPSLDVQGRAEAVSYIKRNGEVLLTLLNDILDISLIEIGEIRILNCEFNLKETIQDIVQQQQALYLQPRNLLEIRYSFDSKWSRQFYGDETRFRQIFSNLLSNALKFTEKGFIEVGYKFDETQLIFFVRDTGIGISRSQQSLVFERFLKYDSGGDRFYSGTGVGLSLCRDLVGLLGGKIWLDSIPGQGSTFFFSLPIEMAADVRSIDLGEKKSYSNVKYSGKNILVAEDVESNFLLLRALLKSSGANILWAKDGLEAIDMAVGGEMDIVLMDIRMPRLDGVEATKRIKELLPKLPVVILTAYSHQEEMERCYAAGCSAYLLKPIKKMELFSVVSRLLA